MSQSPVRSELEKLNAQFVRNATAKDADALVRDFYTNDAVLLPPGAPEIKGADGIRNFWKGMLDAGAGDVALSTQSVDASGDLAYEIGHFKFTMPNPQGGRSTQTGKYVVVYKRQPDGSLKAVADMFSANQ